MKYNATSSPKDCWECRGSNAAIFLHAGCVKNMLGWSRIKYTLSPCAYFCLASAQKSALLGLVIGDERK
jgi:hypothetical protein